MIPPDLKPQASRLTPNALMRRALELAARGEGHVEPNPMVGCVIAAADGIVGEGWHLRFGGDHAEIEALRSAGPLAAGATAYVTLEPCCHTGKTPPCTRALIAAGIRRVVAAQRDPFPEVSGRGLAEFSAAGIEVEVGLLQSEARRLNAPYLHLLATGRPWVIAKWAMSLDGRIATRSGESRWISGEAARAIGHQLRGRVDGILIGRGTAAIDDPLLTARPPGARIATRIIADRQATLSSTSQLVRTARDVPVLVAVGPESAPSDRERLTSAGCDLFVCNAPAPSARLIELLDELGRRRMTNLLVEGGAALLGSLWDAQLIDEVHVFIAPKLIGGSAAPGPLGGQGIEHIAEAMPLDSPQVQQLEPDLYVSGRISRPESTG